MLLFLRKAEEKLEVMEAVKENSKALVVRIL